jgi:hypothetical protein
MIHVGTSPLTTRVTAIIQHQQSPRSYLPLTVSRQTGGVYSFLVTLYAGSVM